MGTLLRSLLSAHVALLFVATATSAMVFFTRMLVLLLHGMLNYTAALQAGGVILVAAAMLVAWMSIALTMADNVRLVQLWKHSAATTGWRYGVVVLLDVLVALCALALASYVAGVAVMRVDVEPADFSEMLLLWVVKLFFAAVAPFLMYAVLRFSNRFKLCAGL